MSSAATITDDQRYFRGICRAAGGAVIFALPLLMTMEMWWLGFTIDRMKLLLLVLLLLPIESRSPQEDHGTCRGAHF